MGGSYTDHLLFGFGAGLTIFVFVLYPLIVYPVLRRRLRGGRRVEFTAHDGRVRQGTISTTPGFGVGLSAKSAVRVESDDGDVLEVPYKKVKPLKYPDRRG